MPSQGCSKTESGDGLVDFDVEPPPLQTHRRTLILVSLMLRNFPCCRAPTASPRETSFYFQKIRPTPKLSSVDFCGTAPALIHSHTPRVCACGSMPDHPSNALIAKTRVLAHAFRCHQRTQVLNLGRYNQHPFVQVNSHFCPGFSHWSSFPICFLHLQ